MVKNNIVHVAVAVVKNSAGQYLIAKRPLESHQGGLWEFPGGKVENEEDIVDALKRELFEEVGITLTVISPLIQILHDYGDKTVLLDVFTVNDFSGEAFAKENQKIRWINSVDFSLYNFPDANKPIIQAIMLPDQYMITGSFSDEKELLNKISVAIKNGIKLIQFRAHHLTEKEYFDNAEKIYSICKQQNTQLLLNTSVDKYIDYQAHLFSHGLHLNSAELKLYSSERMDADLIISASTHNKNELLLAQQNNIDFVVLSPVNKTLSHPDSNPLGWKTFKQIVSETCIPVFALGGMKEADLDKAKSMGAQGIAAISTFWHS